MNGLQWQILIHYFPFWPSSPLYKHMTDRVYDLCYPNSFSEQKCEAIFITFWLVYFSFICSEQLRKCWVSQSQLRVVGRHVLCWSWLDFFFRIDYALLISILSICFWFDAGEQFSIALILWDTFEVSETQTRLLNWFSWSNLMIVFNRSVISIYEYCCFPSNLILIEQCVN